MEIIVAIVVLFLIFKFGGSLLEGLFSAVGVLGKIIGFVLGVALILFFLSGGC